MTVLKASDELADTNIVVAKIICLDLGWHLEFRKLDDGAVNFMLVFPAVRYQDDSLKDV